MHHIDFVSTIPHHQIGIGLRITDNHAGGEFLLATMEVEVDNDAGVVATDWAAAGCTSFKMNHFIARKDVTDFLERANSAQVFSDLALPFDRLHTTGSSLAKHAENHLRYRLAHQRFLQSWSAAAKNASDNNSAQDRALLAAIESTSPNFQSMLTQLIDADHTALRETLLQSYDDVGIGIALAQRDAHGDCLLDHVAPIFRASSLVADAPVQCLLGATYADGCGDLQADHRIATDFFHQAACHAQKGSFAGLGKMHELGQAGLPVNVALALDIYRRGVEKGDEAALPALHALATRLIGGHEAMLNDYITLQRQSTRERSERQRDAARSASEQAALSARLDEALRLVERESTARQTGENRLEKARVDNAASAAAAQQEIERERTGRAEVEALLATVRVDAAARITTAQHATERAEERLRTVQQQLAVERLNSVRIRGLGSMRTFLRSVAAEARSNTS